MAEITPTDPVVFIEHPRRQRSLPLAIEPRTLAVVLIVWSLISIAQDAPSVSYDLSNLFPAHQPPGPMLGAQLWMLVLSPLVLIVGAAVVIAGGFLMRLGRPPGRSAVLAGLAVALVGQVMEYLPQAQIDVANFGWQGVVSGSAAVALLAGVAYLVVAAGPGSSAGSKELAQAAGGSSRPVDAG